MKKLWSKKIINRTRKINETQKSQLNEDAKIENKKIEYRNSN